MSPDHMSGWTFLATVGEIISTFVGLILILALAALFLKMIYAGLKFAWRELS